jgi:Fe-S oxidoreductase
VLTGNPGCMLQIDSHLRAAGHKVRVRHPIELLVPPQ